MVSHVVHTWNSMMLALTLYIGKISCICLRSSPNVNCHEQSTLFGCSLLEMSQKTRLYDYSQFHPMVWITCSQTKMNQFAKPSNRFFQTLIFIVHGISISLPLLNQSPVGLFWYAKCRFGYQNWLVWLVTMYEKWKHWRYLRDVFTCGMKSTHQNETISPFFDGYVHTMTQCREAKKDDEFASLNFKACCEPGLPL